MYSRLHIEPVGGIAGDMLLAALLDFGVDAETVRSAFARFDEPGLKLTVDSVHVGTIDATYVRSLVGTPQFRRAARTSLVKKTREHAHHLLTEVYGVIERAGLSAAAEGRAKAIFEILATAEAEVHGGLPDTVGMHEVAELDSIMDVVGVAVALDVLGNPQITCGVLPSGRGTVQTSHGELTCPVPAVRAVADRFSIPFEAIDVVGETITPTGAAVVAQLTTTFVRDVPVGASNVGVGAGTKRFPTRPNIVRVYGWS